ncbi:MAG: SDR family oxidoreductase [Armatimonadetes bacterium]|nr:SDR family oxidoreductase [Armatimonadota bacterium]
MANEKRVALVTGAYRGLGLEIVRQLAQQGIRVYLGARSADKAESAAKSLQAEGLDVLPITLDVTKTADIQAAAKLLESKEGKLDILVNNAGVKLDKGDWGGPTASTIPPEDLRHTFDANFFGLVELTQVLLPLIRKSDAGRIVNHSSILGSLQYRADPNSPIYGSKLFGYNSSKTAVNAFTLHLAQELKDTPIKVNSAHPGWVKTDLGGDDAPLDTVEGAKTAVGLALIGPDGPTGGYFHAGKPIPL